MVADHGKMGAIDGINKSSSSSQQAARGFSQQQLYMDGAPLNHLQFASKFIDLDNDGRPWRTGIGSSVWSTASWHTVIPVIGAAVLSLPWAIGQLGWAAGPVVMFLFSFVKYYSTALLADCYLSGDHPITGKPVMQVKIYRFIQYLNVLGDTIGFTTAASISMMAIKRANCFHETGHKNPCSASSNPYMIAFGVVQILFSQIPDLHQIWWLSIVATVMFSTYFVIGLGLSISNTVAKGGIQGSLTGISIGVVTPTQKVWRSFQAFGKIAFAYSFSNTIAEIQDTITIKKATLINVVAMTTFYMLFGCVGYAAFGDMAPDNLLTGFGFYEPFWLLDIANIAIALHLVSVYQIYCQPFFAFVEKWAQQRWPDARFVTKEYHLRLLIPCGSGSGPSYSLNLFRLLWRAAFVVLTTVVSMLLPFFNDVAGFAGALGFWPLTVYYPVKMYVCQKKIPKWSSRWVCLQLLSVACLIISVAVAAGSVVISIVVCLQNYKPFKTMQ